MNSKPYLVRTQAGGFTLIELIVAMGLSVLIAGMCTVLFNQTSLAVRTGAATSDIMGNVRTITTQMQNDARDMIGPIRPIGPNPGPPSEGGYLVIITNTLNGEPINTTQLTEVNENIADDQIAFIAARGDSEPMCPGNISSFSNTSYAAYKRVWYGHVLRTNPDGTDAGGFGSDPNRLANRFVLGRQALFLDGAGVASTIHAKSSVDPNADVVGWGAQTPPIAKLYMGITDISDQSLADLNTDPTPFDPIKLTFFANRLRVNPNPSGNTFSSLQIAQNHAAFVNNVSDFEVYYKLPNDPPGTWNRNPAGATLKWGPGDAGSWPTMIRFRWRMHDWQARLGQANESGRWFEQIIRVKGD